MKTYATFSALMEMNGRKLWQKQKEQKSSSNKHHLMLEATLRLNIGRRYMRNLNVSFDM